MRKDLKPDRADSSGIGDFRPASPALGGLTLKRFAPCAALRPYVQCFWQAKGRIGSEASGVELLHPDGGMGLLFSFGGSLERDGKSISGACWVDGPKLRTAQMQTEANLDLLGVRFHPGRGFTFVGEALSRLAGAELIPGDVLRRLQLEALHEQLWQWPDLAGRIALLERYLLKRLWRHGAQEEPALAASLDWLQLRHGQASIAELAAELPFGQRRLERLFLQRVGLTPKRYARLLRVAHSRELIKQGGTAVSLTDTALAAGYFDQSHFIHDFKAVTGLTPGGYLDHVRRRYGGSLC
ncbi:helix-turn-helix domain-containing protein [Billgrantia sp. LNSP4103-1]|uniref:helix-turn-helix domain-containing protein n=1 Tax=Billgrantia sp. LNSP4103-1 TaxID=3410266 RepID=UPI00403FC165